MTVTAVATCTAVRDGWTCCLADHPDQPTKHYWIHPDQLALW